jgi:hypothetical protein
MEILPASPSTNHKPAENHEVKTLTGRKKLGIAKL